MKTKKLKIPIYGDIWLIVICKDLRKVIKKYNIEGDVSGMDAFTYSKNGTHITAFDKRYVTPSTIAHECVHLLNDIYSFNGVQLDPVNDEPQAYLMGWLIGKVHKLVKL